MTTKFLVVNHGPDPLLVRRVAYGPDVTVPPGKKPKVMDDTYLMPQEDALFYVHRNQQIMIGERRDRMEIEAREINLPADPLPNDQVKP